MRVFNLAEELEKERKKNKELEIELKEAKESITWWTNRFNAVERDNREIQNRIDKAVEYLETLEKREAYKIEDNENGFPTLKVDNEEYLVICKYNKLLDILKGDNK